MSLLYLRHSKFKEKYEKIFNDKNKVSDLKQTFLDDIRSQRIEQILNKNPQR